LGEITAAVPFFDPLIDVIERAVRAEADGPYAARVYVDAIDRWKAKGLTNALRRRHISLKMVQGRRDESEPLIRLADMWAGCIRRAFEESPWEAALLNRALHLGNVRSL
jgi:hypothetical protein